MEDKRDVKTGVKASILPHRETHFSWLRTRMSVERTLMSWVRTATAMIGFGFTIFQFFDRFNQMAEVAPPRHPMMLRTIPLALTALGSIALAIAIADYRKGIAYLWNDEFSDIAGPGEQPSSTPALALAVLLAVVGVMTLGVLLTRL